MPKVPPVAIRQVTAGHGTPAIGGLVPFSSVDWPGQFAAVLFISGCPWRCSYCHNPHLQHRHTVYSWVQIENFLSSRKNLLDAVVFSGGEPLSEPALPAMIGMARAMGYRIGLHTAGIYPKRLAALLPQLDWIGLDIKTDATGYDALTGVRNSHTPAMQSLELILDAACSFECRTTWSPCWLSEPDLLRLAEMLAKRGVQRYSVQNFRAAPEQMPEAQLSEAARQQLRSWFAEFDYR
ncbi:anaerobic ribonucleoside-triphosphate reductase activating protein [Chitinimonas naiadis]